MRKLTPVKWNREITRITRVGAKPTPMQRAAAYIRYLTAR